MKAPEAAAAGTGTARMSEKQTETHIETTKIGMTTTTNTTAFMEK